MNFRMSHLLTDEEKIVYNLLRAPKKVKHSLFEDAAW